ncbi:hypothetical protein [Pengzhenrongella phosphoraccumulans]|uniref:hypothetical protein n=1 Tax=Pengzhenrongella phosphoraccumulans TaxID=3114394 RepID=UPI00388D7A95
MPPTSSSSASCCSSSAGGFASDPDLAASLSRFVGAPGYDLYKLRVDLDRFGILKGAVGDEPPPREHRSRSPRHP